MDIKIITLAGGCFWCVEHDLRGLPGVVTAVSGYATHNDTDRIPSYENHVGFREAVQISYDSSVISYKKIVQFFLEHIDPTDNGGQFYDRGEPYQTAIYFTNREEETIARSLVHELDTSGIYHTPVTVEVLPFVRFVEAEDYHQHYADKNPGHYNQYRKASGREDFVQQICQIREERHIVWKD